MEFKVKTFAQLMILSHEVTLVFDEITEGKLRIDSYEIAQHPEIAQSELVEVMKRAFDSIMSSDQYRSVYENLYKAPNDELFWDLLKKKNNLRKHIS